MKKCIGYNIMCEEDYIKGIKQGRQEEREKWQQAVQKLKETVEAYDDKSFMLSPILWKIDKIFGELICPNKSEKGFFIPSRQNRVQTGSDTRKGCGKRIRFDWQGRSCNLDCGTIDPLYNKPILCDKCKKEKT